ncbi:MAG: M56 family metallopeptidase, partial [candidate division Zixibacteria bacterium]|nr:M56 family metallopeptidase [candidate division Zixibacteria bacterium]
MEPLFDAISKSCHGNVQLLVNGLWVGVVLTLGLAVTLRYVRSMGAATRYALWWGTLLIVAGMPFLLNGTLAVPDMMAAANSPAAAYAQAEPTSRTQHTSDRAATPHHTARPATPVLHLEPTTKTGPIGPLAKPATDPGKAVLGLLPLILCSIWLTVSLVLLARVVGAYRRVLKMKHACVPLDDQRYYWLYARLNRLSPRRSIRLAVSEDIDHPVAAGFGRPAILIPRDLLHELSNRELEVVVMHELAHLLRHDDWGVLTQQICTALLFFHPAVLWIGRQMELEREIACDDWVIGKTGEPGEYARCLTHLVQLTSGTGTTLVPGALTGQKRIFKRFENILSGRHNKGGFSRMRFMLAAIVLSLTVVLTANLAPVFAFPIDVVTFSDVVALVGHPAPPATAS